MKDPRRVLSPHVASVHESTPAFEASMKGDSIIPATWGDLASRIVEEDLVEPDIEAVCDYLQISREELADPEITISSVRDVYYLRERIEAKSRNEFVESYGEVANEFGKYMDERTTAWAVEDGEIKGDEIQRQVDAQVPDRFSDEWDEYSNDPTRRDQTSLLCLKRDALRSGVQVPLIDFAKAVFVEFEGQRFFTSDELADCIDAMIQAIVREYVMADPEQVKVEDVVLGKEQINEFMWATKDLFNSKKNKSVREDWEKLEPFLYAPNPYEYPLLERSS